MSIFTHDAFDGHEEVAFFHDSDTGLRAIIAIHNLNRGPALGGCRMWAYGSEEDAITDARPLAKHRAGV